MSTSTTTRHHRKQRFPRLDRRRLFHEVYRSHSPSDFEDNRFSDDSEFVDDDEEYYCKRPRLSAQVGASSRPSTLRTVRQPAASAPSSKRQHQPQDTTCRLDKRARDEHNEQERSRRRELAVIYELIRCSFSEDDLRYLGQCSGPKSVEKLSYPQVLQIAYQLLLEEQHNLVMFEKSLQAIRLVEKEYLHIGLPVPQRPFCPAIPDSHRKVVQVVDSLLRQDKSARTPDGIYEVTPAERAAIGDHQLSAVFPHPAEHDMPGGGQSRSLHTSTGLISSSSALTSHPKTQPSRPSNLLITNGATRVHQRSSGSSPQAVRRLVSAGSSSSSSRATVQRNAFKLSTSHSDSSSCAGSPHVSSAGVESSLTDGSVQQLMVFDWLGLKNGAGGDEDISECEDLSRAAPLQRRSQPVTSVSGEHRLIRTSNGRSTRVTWSIRQQQLKRDQDPSEEDEGVVIDPMPPNTKSLVSRSFYSNVKA